MRTGGASGPRRGRVGAVNGAAVPKLVHLAKLTLGRARPQNDAQRRYQAIARGAATAGAARAVGLVVGFLLVPLCVGYLGAERYGVWITVSSTLTWLYLADLGIGNGLTNVLSSALGLGDRGAAQRHVATAFWLLTASATLIGAVFMLAWPFVDWARVFNVEGRAAGLEVRALVGWAVALYLAAFPFAILEKIYAAHGEGTLANAWGTADSVLTLVAVLAVTRTQGGLVALVLAVAGTHLAVVLANATWLFRRHLPDLAPRWSRASWTGMREVAGPAAQFFLIQVVGLVLFSTDNVIIARVLDPAAVTPYSVAWKLFTIPTLFVSLHAPYVWPAYSEAHARRDARWIRRTVALSAGSSFAVAVILAIPLAVFGQPLCRAWAGAAAVPTPAVLWWMAAWAVVSSPASAVAVMLNGVGQLSGQLAYGAVAAAVNVCLSIWWARVYGTSGVIAATVVSYLVCAATPATLEALWTLRRLRREEVA